MCLSIFNRYLPVVSQLTKTQQRLAVARKMTEWMKRVANFILRAVENDKGT